MRLFIAIDLPEEIKQIIEEIKAPLNDIKGVKPVKKENIHFTMKFLGEVGEDKVNGVVEALAQVKFSPFKLSVNKMGFFPNEKRIRVLWVDAVPAEPMRELKQEIDKALPQFKDDHSFKNHLTFARIKYLANDDDKKKILELITNTQIEKKEFLVDKFTLYKSTLMPEGPVYGVVEEFSLTNLNIAVVDDEDNIIDYKPRDFVDSQGLRYRVSALWITNSKGHILLARRGYTKSHDPGKWGPAVAGTVEEGESYENNIIKEAEEELGLKNIVVKKGPKTKVDDKHKHYTQWFTCVIDKPIKDFQIQKDEVAEIKWFSQEEIKKELANNPKEFLKKARHFLNLF